MDPKLNLNTFDVLSPVIPSGMTHFQMAHFVMDEQLTAYRKVRQAILEIHNRMEVLTTTSFEIESLQIDLDEARTKVDNQTSEFDKRRIDLEIRQLEYKINRKRVHHDLLVREVTFFTTALDGVVEENYGTVQQALIKVLEDKDANQAELEYWVMRFTRQAASDLINYGTITKGVIDAVRLLPADAQAKILSDSTKEANELSLRITHNKDNALIGVD